MERRLQLLLDQDRYDRVRREADSSGRSVAAVIREAIDLRLPSDAVARAEAMRAFLAATEQPDDVPAESWADMKRIYDEDQAAHTERVIAP